MNFGTVTSAAKEAAEKSKFQPVLKGHGSVVPYKFFIFVIPRGLQPAEDLLFRFFQQPLKPLCRRQFQCTSEGVPHPRSTLIVKPL